MVRLYRVDVIIVVLIDLSTGHVTDQWISSGTFQGGDDGVEHYQSPGFIERGALSMGTIRFGSIASDLGSEWSLEITFLT